MRSNTREGEGSRFDPTWKGEGSELDPTKGSYTGVNTCRQVEQGHRQDLYTGAEVVQVVRAREEGDSCPGGSGKTVSGPAARDGR